MSHLIPLSRERLVTWGQKYITTSSKLSLHDLVQDDCGLPVASAGYVFAVDQDKVIVGKGVNGRFYVPGGKSVQYPLVQSLSVLRDQYQKKSYKLYLESCAFSQELYLLLEGVGDGEGLISSLLHQSDFGHHYTKFLAEKHPDVLDSLEQALGQDRVSVGLSFGDIVKRSIKKLVLPQSTYVGDDVSVVGYESPRDTAIREFSEEIGYSIDGNRLSDLCSIDVIREYCVDGKSYPFIKRCHYFVYGDSLEGFVTKAVLTANEKTNQLTNDLYPIDGVTDMLEDRIRTKVRSKKYGGVTMMLAHWLALLQLQKTP